MEPKEEKKDTGIKEKLDLLLKEKQFQRVAEKISFYDYLNLLCKDGRPARTAFQRIYDMMVGAGVETTTDFGEKTLKYKFFESLDKNNQPTKDSLFGLDHHLLKLVEHLKNGAYKLGGEKRLLLLEGPVGSAKSTIARLLKRGLERESLENPLYTFRWKGLGVFGSNDMFQVKDGISLFNHTCQLHEDPIKLLYPEIRGEVLHQINSENKSKGLMKYPIEIEGELCPHCKFNFDHLTEYYKGDWNKVMEHIEVFRLFLSEAGRVGIATFSPKDEKNQDSTELTGNIDYRKIAILGSDSDPRAFNFDGEFHVANRGLIEFIEVLKLETAFLYDLLIATQEQVVKPKKHAQTDIDELIIAHTNEPELRKLEENELMEAFRDRTKRVKVPYNLKLAHEMDIYEKDYGQKKLGEFKHMAPHTIEMLAMFAILSRLDEPKEQALTLIQKLDLYNGKSLSDVSEDIVRKLMNDGQREGLYGVSPRFIQDTIADTLAGDDNAKCVNVFMVWKKVRDKLKTSILISKDEDRLKYQNLLEIVEERFQDIVKDEVQQAVASDERSIKELFSNYINNVKAYIRKAKVQDSFTGYDAPPDEALMRSIEKKIGVTDQQKDEYRNMIMNHIGALAIESKPFDYKANPELHKALVKKLFEEKKDTINFRGVVEDISDDQEQEKIDIIKKRLMENYGYCDVCAKDMLTYVANIFAKGDSKK